MKSLPPTAVAFFLLTAVLSLVRVGAGAPKPQVEVRIADGNPALEQTVSSALLQAGVEPELRRAAAIDPRDLLTPAKGAPRRFAHVWLDLTDLERIVLYVVDERWERVLIRFVPRSRDNPALDHEQIAQILRTTVEALRYGARIGITQEAARELLLPHQAKPVRETRPGEQPRGLAWRAGVIHEMQVWSSTPHVAQSPGLVVAASELLQPLSLEISASAQYRRLVLNSSPVGGRMDSAIFRGILSTQTQLSENWRWRSGIGGGLDWIHLTPRSEAADLSPTKPRTLIYGMARVQSGLSWSSKSGPQVYFAWSAEFDPSDLRLTVEREVSNEALFDPWRVRPGMMIEVRW